MNTYKCINIGCKHNNPNSKAGCCADLSGWKGCVDAEYTDEDNNKMSSEQSTFELWVNNQDLPQEVTP
jgi:hypothetical protein